jgi:PAS domain S-box-containing protein
MAHTIRVLLVDADIDDAADLREKLAGAKNVCFVTQTAGTIAEAFRTLEEKRVDALLLDLTTPGSEGIATLREFQARAPETPILIISSQHNEAESLETVRTGAQDYLVKKRLNAAAIERILVHCIERERTRARTQMQYLISRVLTEAEKLGAANTDILKILCDFLEYDFGQVWLFDHWSDELIAGECWHPHTEAFADLRRANQALRLERAQDIPGRVWEEVKSISVPDLVQNGGFGRLAEASSAGLRSLLAFPISLRAEVLGVIELFSKDVREVDDELLTTVTNLGTQLGQFVARKHAEEERERLTKERVLLLDCASEGIYGLDLKGCITFMNRAAARMFRCDADEVSGNNSHELFHHTHPDGTPYPADGCPVQHVLRTAEGTRLDHEYFWRTDGSHFPVDYSVFPVIEEGTIRGAVICFSDISERRRMEIELRHAQKLEAVGGLAAGIAHEINTPIQFVGDNTRFLQDSFRDGMEMIAKYEQVAAEAEEGEVKNTSLQEVKEVCKRIDWDYLKNEIPKAMEQMLDGVARVAKIVRAMKEFSHVDRSSEKAPSDLNKALESTLIVARSELKYVADVETEFGNLPPVLCHLGDLNQVFLNLLINAAHAIADVVKGTGERGRVVVRTRQAGEQVEISVSDSGSGIPEAVRQKIFDPFFTTKEVGKGTGQGLTLARAIVVEKHGGTLTFDTEMGKGTTFFVRLPISGTLQPREVVAK